jgi:hypothetical protein
MGYRVFRWLYPVLHRISPNIGISSEDLAQAMVRVGLDDSLAGNSPVLENRDIRKVVSQ